MGPDSKSEVSQEKSPFPLKIESTPDQAYSLLALFFFDTKALQDFLDERVVPHNETPASLRSLAQGDFFKSSFAEKWNSQRNPQDWPDRTPRVAFTEAAVKAANSIATQASKKHMDNKLTTAQLEQTHSRASLVSQFILRCLDQFQT